VKAIRIIVVSVYLLLAMLPLVWLGITALKTYPDAVSTTAKFIPSLSENIPAGSHQFAVSGEGFSRLDGTQPDGTVSDESNFWGYLLNSLLIASVSTIASVVMGTSCAYGFSRFKIGGEKDWLFFILSTRFLPPLAVVVPIYFMWTRLNLLDSHLGLMILYTAFNLSLSVWLMKGFINEIPKAFEEAALVDGYSRLGAFFKIVVPQARTGMAVTAVFCMISAWNEYGFAMTLNSSFNRTVPVFFAGQRGQISGTPWPQIAAGTLLFVLPIVGFTILVRKHLLRGVTFGTVKG
jgi:multiple sugar transport system permease protein